LQVSASAQGDNLQDAVESYHNLFQSDRHGNNVYRLKKQGKIIAKEKGIYVKA